MASQKITINTGLHYAVYEKVWYDAESGELSFSLTTIDTPSGDWKILRRHYECVYRRPEHEHLKQEHFSDLARREAEETRQIERDRNYCLEFERRVSQAGYEFEKKEPWIGMEQKIVNYKVKIPANLTPRDVVDIFCKIVRRGMLVEGK